MKISRARLWDLLAASPLLGSSLLGAWGFLILLGVEAGHLEANDLRAWTKIIPQLGGLIYLAVLSILLFVRYLPLTKSPGVVPRLVAIAASNAPLALLFVPRTTLSLPMEIVSAAVMSSGALAAIWVLYWLRRSFSILPQARALVVTGPYRQVRHPLYVAEEIACLGLMLQFAQPWSGAIMFVGFGLQLLRMHYEEKVLTATFPLYASYKARTFRLVPGIY